MVKLYLTLLAVLVAGRPAHGFVAPTTKTRTTPTFSLLLGNTNTNNKPASSVMILASTTPRLADTPTGWDSFRDLGTNVNLPSGEEQRKYRRTVYTHKDWKKHRSQDRFIWYIIAIFKSGVYKNLGREVAATTLIATFVFLYNIVTGGFTDLAGIQHGAIISADWLPKLGLPLSAFTLTSPSLGLLLVFRTNTSYQRWDEARKNWGMNINRTRDLVRQANVYYDDTNVSPEQRKDDLQHTALCTWAFVRSMKRHLSPEEEDEDVFRQELFDKLPAQQAQMIIDAAHRPNRALQDLSYAIDDLPMHFLRKNEIHKSLTNFEDNLGSSERLLTSPVPLFYSRHLARFLAIWLLLLPFALYDTFAASWNHIGMIPATAVISIFLFGIEELGVQLEEPFTILPMQAFCDKIYNWCMEIVKWTPGDNGRPMKPVRVEHSSFMPGAPMPAMMEYYSATMPPPPQPMNMNGDTNGGYYTAADLEAYNAGYYMDPAGPQQQQGPPPQPNGATPPQPMAGWASNANTNYADAQKMSFTEFLQRQGKTQ